jgi:NADP-dependent 3-hydroxy acid dehydrogenase YdfG
VVETNVLGTAYAVRACLPHLIARGGGDVVLLSSIAGRRPSPVQPIYSASKWGLVGLGQAMRTEAAKHGVRVTLMEPGMVDTSLARGSARGQELLKTVRPLATDDVANAVLFALSQPPNVCVAELVLMPAGQA